MTRITILEQKLSQLQEKRNAADLACGILEASRGDLLTAMFNRVFASALEPTDVLVVSSDRVQFTRPEPGYNYNKQVLDLYFRSEYWKDAPATQIQTSFYSTTDNSKFELRRMILLGKVGQIVLDQSLDVLQQFNTIKSDTQSEIQLARTAERALQREMAVITKQIAELQQFALLDQLHDTGIEFNTPNNDAHRLPTIAITANHTIRGVKCIRVTDRTASGKSADIRVTRITPGWDAVTDLSVDRETEIAVYKVRMSVIDAFIRANADLVIPTA